MILKINLEFQGIAYVAEVTPVINGREVAVKPEMLEAEKLTQIYSRKLQAMAKQYETSYQPEFGLLVSANAQGFQFAKAQIAHTDQVWKDFVRSLFRPEEELADENVGPDAKVNFTDVSLYKGASTEEKSQALINLYLKKLREFKGQKVQYDPIEEQCHARFIMKYPHKSILKKDKAQERAELYQKLVRKKKEGKISREAWDFLEKQIIAIHKAPAT
jgi:hypothetical protein